MTSRHHTETQAHSLNMLDGLDAWIGLLPIPMIWEDSCFSNFFEGFRARAGRGRSFALQRLGTFK